MQPVTISHYLDFRFVTFRSPSQWIVLVSRDGERPTSVAGADRESALAEAKVWADKNVFNVGKLER